MSFDNNDDSGKLSSYNFKILKPRDEVYPLYVNDYKRFMSYIEENSGGKND
jgi:hypothetical protein